MSYLPELTILGKLHILEIYDYYDQPCLFSCQNQSGQIYIVIWVDTTSTGDTWLYASVSSSKFKSITKGKIDIRNIFTNSEDSFVFEVITPYRENLPPTVKVIPCNEIEENYLPEPGEIIESEIDYCIKSIEIEAQEKNKEIIDFILQFPQEDISEAPIGELGLILHSFQDFIDAIGQIKSGKADSNIISQPIKNQTRIVLSHVFTGSFGMRLEGSFYEEDLFGESLVGQCIHELIELINLGASTDSLQVKLLILKKKTASKYKELLEALTLSGISKLHIDWASPKNNRKSSVEINLNTMYEVIEIIKNTKLKSEQEIQTIVKVKMINYQTKKVRLLELSSNKTYNCEIEKSAIKDVETINESSIYIATIRDYVILTTVTDIEKHEYILLGLKLHGDESENNLLF